MNSVIYHLQFGFRQKYLTSLALIHLTDKIREQLNSGTFTSGIFFDIQKVFHTVDSSYLQNRLQYVSINVFDSSLEHIYCGVPQVSILWPLLFLIHINDLNGVIRYCPVHHFADDTNLLNYNNLVKRMNKQVHQDLKNLTNWLNANKIFLNVGKREVVSFKSSKKIIDAPLKLKLNGKRLYSTKSLKYLRKKIDEKMNWKKRFLL